MTNTMPIPNQWSFDAPAVAQSFDDHVREQLPFYDLATKAVVDLARLHLPVDGTVYDLGASNGNIARALTGLLDERQGHMVSIECSPAMCSQFNGPGTLIQADLLDWGSDEGRMPEPDVVISFLTLGFLPVVERQSVLHEWADALRPGGALILVERIQTDKPLSARYLIQAAKLRAGATGDNVTAKEVSIGGVLRPLDPRMVMRYNKDGAYHAWCFFSFGDFAGFIIEKSE